MIRPVISIALTATFLTALSHGALAQSNRLNPTADLALINGSVHTMDATGTVAEAIGIEEDRIVYVGDVEGLKNVIGIGTKVIDLDGAMVLPGFVDGHSHPFAGGLIMQGIDLQSDDRDEIFQMIRDHVATNDDEIVLGYGIRFNPWTNGNPTAAMLDEIESERPLFFFTIDGHGAWANSKALELAGIDKDTPDTVPGYSFFERDADGNPTGWIIEVPAMMQVFSELVPVSPEYILQGVKTWLPRFSTAGLTSVQDFGIMGVGQAEGFAMLEEMADAGELPIRIRGVYYWNDGGIDPIAELQALTAKFDHPQTRPQKIKINVDGGDDKWNAIYTAPYADKPDVDPKPIIPRDVIIDVIVRADALGIDVTCHCWGDAATRIILDGVEQAIAANPARDRRHVVSHGSLVHADDVPRFAELGVGYDTSGAWMSYDPLMMNVTDVRLGKERVQNQYPMARVAAAGGRVSLGADWPAAGWASSYEPLTAIETAVTRTAEGRKDVPPLGGEEAKVPLDTALRAATINAAWNMNLDDEIGSLETGKKADIVVLEKNLFEIDPNDIAEVKVLYTMMDGKLTHDHEAE